MMVSPQRHRSGWKSLSQRTMKRKRRRRREQRGRKRSPKRKARTRKARDYSGSSMADTDVLSLFIMSNKCRVPFRMCMTSVCIVHRLLQSNTAAS